MAQNTIFIQTQAGVAGNLQYFRYKWKGSLVTIGFGYDETGKLVCVNIPTSLNLPHVEIIRLISSLFLQQVNNLVALNVDQSGFRKEYSPYLVGQATWITPTIIAHNTADELAKGWTTSGNVTVVGDDMVLTPIAGGISTAVLLGNIHFGTWMNNRVKWGCMPALTALRSIGFDLPNWYDFIGFYMDGAVFKAVTRNIIGSTNTDITASFPVDGDTAYHTYEIEWFTDGVKFYIDATLVATHVAHLPRGPAGLAFYVGDVLAGNLQIQKSWELEQFRFPILMS